ncbi:MULTISPECIES: MarR family winged helix-turn-helix transcriptional regulator [Rhizobium]|nr:MULTISPECIES: MarR family transcriptional regulator [Rhizobium]PST62494.1 MarR family transcriptional regulator [Rhizobium sp. SEMIA4064]
MTDDPLKLDTFICFALYSANHAMNRLYKPMLDELNLTYPQYLVMVTLWEEDGQTVGGIGEKLFLESSTLTPLLKRLEAAGFIRRTRSKEDERQVLIRLTSEGTALKKKATGIPACILDASDTTANELTRLKVEIIKLREALSKNAA